MKNEIIEILRSPKPIQKILVRLLMTNDSNKNAIIGILRAKSKPNALEELVDILFEIGLTETEIEEICKQIFD